MSPLTESGSESVGIPYSHMTEEEAQVAYSSRKDQIRKMLKARSNLQTPDSESKCSVSSIKSKQSAKNPPVRFTVEPGKVSKHSIDSSLGSQQDLKERLKNFSLQAEVPAKKYNVHEPIYKRTVEWKREIVKAKEEQKEEKDKKIAEECTFEPSIEKSDIRNLSVGIYERNVQWKNSLVKKHEASKDLNVLKEIEECSFKPKLVSNPSDFSVDFQQRNLIWQERMMLKAKKIEEENTKDQVFHPKINKTKKSSIKTNNLDNRFSAFLNRLDEISEKIENSLAGPVQ
jgi:hypothetical protein